MPRQTETPVPTADLVVLSNTLVRVDQNVKSIKNDILPPLVVDTREARDNARDALAKINGHASDEEAHEHSCVDAPRQERQDTKISGLSKVFWIALSVFVAIVSGSYGYTLVISNSTTENATSIKGQSENINRHEKSIEALRVSRQLDRETYLKSINDLPSRVTESVQKAPGSSQEVVERAAEDLPLRPHERRQLRELMSRARERSNGDGG